MTTAITQKEMEREEVQSHAMRCMEVWGGNERTDRGLSVPGIDAWISSSPHDDGSGGGDIHYVSLCGGGRIARFAIADVSGHGAEASEVAVALRGLMRKYINTPNQARFARALNRSFSRLARPGRFATAVLTTYFAPTDHLIITNAGHPRPLWYHAPSSTWLRIEEDMPQRADKVRNLPLGVIEPTEYVQFAVPLSRGDLVVIYTDALIEARGPDGQMLGEDGLLELVRSLDVAAPQDFHTALLDEVAAFRGGEPAADDETVLVLHHNAADPPRQSLGEMMRVMAHMVGLAGD